MFKVLIRCSYDLNLIFFLRSIISFVRNGPTEGNCLISFSDALLILINFGSFVATTFLCNFNFLALIPIVLVEIFPLEKGGIISGYFLCAITNKYSALNKKPCTQATIQPNSMAPTDRSKTICSESNISIKVNATINTNK